MKTHIHPSFVTVAGLVLVLLVPCASAQDLIAPARDFYASARYDQALAVLDTLKAVRTTDADPLTIEKYRVLCLLALGRDRDADTAVAGVVALDPEYLPDGRDVAPSVRNFFITVRQRVLPEVAQAKYLEAKAAYDAGQYARAADGFRSVIALLDDPDMGGRLADLRLVAQGFQELSAKALPPPPAPAAPAPETPPAPDPAPSGSVAAVGAAGTASPADPSAHGADDLRVTPPRVLRQVLPPVTTGVLSVWSSRGSYEITIDDRGRVAEVKVLRSLNASYDRAFINAASAFRYEPAVLNGHAVSFRKIINVTPSR